MKKIILLTILVSLITVGCGQKETESEKKDFKPANEKVFGE